MIEDYLHINNERLFYTLAGKGEPIILIHGNFNDHQIWNEQVAAFSTHYCTIRYDLRGYGLSSTPKSSFSNIEDLKVLISSLNLNKITLIGSSSGGGVAIDFAIAYPDLLQALIIISPSVNGKPYAISMLLQGIKNYINVHLTGRIAAIESFISNRYWQYFLPSVAKKEARAQVIKNVRNINNFCRFSPKLSVPLKPYAIKRLHEINIPTLVIISDQDHPYNLKTAETIHSNIKKSSKIIMQDCGHLPFIEEPDTFNQIVLKFLSQYKNHNPYKDGVLNDGGKRV